MLPWNIPRLGGAAFCVLCGGFQVLHLAWCSGHHPFDDWLVVSTPLKNMKVSSGYYSQCMEKMFQTTTTKQMDNSIQFRFLEKKLRIFSSHVCHVDWNGTFYNISDHVKLGFSNHVNLGLSRHVTLPKGITRQHTLEI